MLYITRKSKGKIKLKSFIRKLHVFAGDFRNFPSLRSFRLKHCRY